ncbi:MAG TPA: MotA/TolQ/ExbB proton channel family protein [Chthoniobacter sp.]|jgi:biopolymer transport protein ExbB/TolQ
MKKSLLVSGIVVGSILALGPVWGAIGSALGMMRAFHTLGSANVSDPRALSADIGQTLMALTFGLIACPVGIALLAICIVFLVQSKKQALPPLPPQPPTA